MSPQIDPLSRHLDISRNLLEQTLSGMEQLLTLGIDHTQDFVSRSSQQLKGTLSDSLVVTEAAQLPDAMQQGIHVAINLARDTTLAATDYQIDALRLLHNQASEVQKTLAAAITEQFAIVDQNLAGTPRTGTATANARKARA
ncbi:MAG: hypothetical protein CVU34_00180 [Betaproteobacteria bacterium HGW-Betaproteobacteria-7]|jgi:hypothetical protein|nr:MAG: hypothetical protein CVU34_00180 [Betaproteobacteria bacterium HGW-Betaproteobacteria-7]